MTLQQTINIPISRKVHFDVVLPKTVPCGKAEVTLDFTPSKTQVEPSLQQREVNLDPVLKKALEEAEKKRLYNQAHPDELRESLQRLQGGNPLFSGIGAAEFKRRSENEWESRI